MTFVHYFQDPYQWYSKFMMTMVVLLAIRRTFNFLKIFEALSPIVTMIQRVLFDLRIFLTFYMILVVLISLMFGVLGLGNDKLDGEFKDLYAEGGSDGPEEAPNYEYYKVGLFVGNIIQVIRISMGDFAIIGVAGTLKEEENIVFWIIWLSTVIITCVVFLNFIVAEASASYTDVSENLDNFIQEQKAELVAEAESLMPDMIKSEKSFPRYIVTRKVET